MPPKKKTKAKVLEPEPEPEYEEEEPLVISNNTEGEIEDDEGGITRCVCKIADEDVGMMIQCETCKVWQHGICVGLENESDCPETYYCELCRPDLHVDLLKSLKKTHPRYASTAMPPPSTSHDHTPHKLTAANLIASATTSTSQSQSSRSQSPPLKSSARRRNTLNSREAAYAEALQVGDLEALDKITAAEEEGGVGGKRKRKRSGGVGNDEATAPKRKRSSEVPGSTTPDPQDPNDLDSPQKDMLDGQASVNGSLKGEATIRRGKRAKKEKEASQETEATSNPPPSNPPTTKKHANQYTYRGKVTTSGVTSPTKGTPSATARTGHAGSAAPEATGRRAGGTGTGTTATATTTSRIATSPAPPPLTWNLPDHLSHLADLLPTPAPVGIEVRLSASQERSLEKGAKVRWPMKRTTVGEMRRRVRAMLDYVTKAQGDTLEREKRVKALDASLLKAAEEERARTTSRARGRTSTANSTTGEDNAREITMRTTGSPSPIADGAPSEPIALAPSNPISAAASSSGSQDETTAERLASLTQGLLQFQEKFGAGPGGKIYRERIERERRPRGAAAAAAAMDRDD